MNSDRRNMLVGVFVFIGLVALGWLIFKFQDFPAWISGYDATHVTVYFPEAPGVQENTSVLFRGYNVGRVTSVEPPRLLPDLDDPQKTDYQVAIHLGISLEHKIPKNVHPKVFKRGLGGSYVDLVIEPTVIPAPTFLADGDQIKGILSEGSDFISESTQRKLDGLINSLTELSNQLQFQLTPLPPDVVDQADPEKVHANITTAVMRLDQTLKHVNVFVGDPENQHNIKKGLAEFVKFTEELRTIAQSARQLVDNSDAFVRKGNDTLDTVDTAAQQFTTSVKEMGTSIQNTADQLAANLEQIRPALQKLSNGEGTAGKMLTDPELYESLTDLTQRLSLAADEFRELMDNWNKKGVKLR